MINLNEKKTFKNSQKLVFRSTSNNSQSTTETLLINSDHKPKTMSPWPSLLGL